MALTKNDLQAIKGMFSEQNVTIIDEVKGLLSEQKETIIEEVKDLIDFRAQQTELKFSLKFDQVDQRFEQVDQRFDRIEGEISDLIEINQAFIGQFDNHEKRITRLEMSAGSVK